jgi:methylthioribulose-1-phosphate dehydratase
LSQRKNMFPSPSPYQKVLLSEMCRVAKFCYDRGWSWGTAGNFSVRGNDHVIWQSPSGLCKGDLRPDLFVAVDLETELAVEPWTQKPSLEMPVHAGIYKSIHEAQCVVHTHPTSVVIASHGKKRFTFQGYEMAKALGLFSHEDQLEIPILPNVGPVEMKSFSEGVARGIPKVAKVVVLEGHGVWAWGRTPMEALSYLEALELLCKSDGERSNS